MKIPKEFPQFKDEKALIVVAGKQEALIYQAKDGVLERIDEIKVETPHYSDHEGEFRRRGKAGIQQSGASRELRDRDIIRDFIHEMQRHIKGIPVDFSKLYIMVPETLKRIIPNALPTAWKQKVRRVITGNYHHFRNRPLMFVGKVAEARL
jgi:hypothetical protein